MDDFDFDETLTLRGPLALPPPRAGGPRTHLYFSTLDRGGKDVIVCVAVAVPIGSKSPLHADGTRAHVIGSGRAVRATLMVAAKCVLPLSCDPRVVEECQPSLLWAALILGGVVSSANLVTSQPSLTLASISVHRQPGVARAAVHIMCTVDVPAAAVQEVAIVASVVSYTDDSLSVEVSDVNTCAPDAAPGFLATLLLFVHWLGTVLRIVRNASTLQTASTLVQLQPSLSSLSLDDDGFPAGNLPQVIISGRRAVQSPPPPASVITRRIYSGVEHDHVRWVDAPPIPRPQTPSRPDFSDNVDPRLMAYS